MWASTCDNKEGRSMRTVTNSVWNRVLLSTTMKSTQTDWFLGLLLRSQSGVARVGEPSNFETDQLSTGKTRPKQAVQQVSTCRSDRTSSIRSASLSHAEPKVEQFIRRIALFSQIQNCSIWLLWWNFFRNTGRAHIGT